MEISYPSERFPAPPTITFQVPDTWDTADAPPAQITVFDTESPDYFRVNFMVSVKRVVTEANIVQAAERFATETRGRFPDYEIVGENHVMLNGLEAVVRAQRVTPLGAEYPIFQAEVLLYAPDPRPGVEDVKDIVQVHGSCPGDLAEHYAPIFKAMVESLQITRPEAAAGQAAAPTGVQAF